MAAVAKSGTPSVCTQTPSREHQISGLVAGEAIAAGDACYIKAADGFVWLSTGAAANAAAKVRGFAFTAAAVGEAVTLYHGVNWRYGAALSPGADLFLSAATPGALSDAATTGGTAPIGFVIDATRVHLDKSRY
jgi:hypothetical protein